MAQRKPARPPSAGRPTGGAGFIRLIAGQWRGRKLPVRDVIGLRPTTDRVKETLFNWLAPHLAGSRCLDLFAGSGSLGFEALSRHAGHVMMVERDKGAAQQLLSNLQLLGCQQARVLQQDALQVLTGPADPFDIVFLDPPFRQDLLPQVSALLEERGWLADEALIYLERENEGEPPRLPANWRRLKDKQAGQVCYQLYARTTSAARKDDIE